MGNIDLINCINGLIETCKDGEYGFRACAEQARRAELKVLFNARADDCIAAAGELQGLVAEQLGGMPERGGSASGALHRGWVAVKGRLKGYSDLALLEECERGEDVAKEHYLDALAQDLPKILRDVVQRHFEGVERNHAQVRSLCDEERLARA